MRHITILGLLLVYSLLSVLSVQGQSSCVQCLPGIANPNVLTCQPAVQGALECATIGTVCTVSGPCGRSRPDGSGCEISQTGKVEVSVKTIDEIGVRYPDLAAAIAQSARSGFLGGKGVKAFVLPSNSRFPVNAFAPLVYDVSISGNDVDPKRVIRITLEQGTPTDPLFNSLELQVEEVLVDKAASGALRSWRVTAWQIN